MIGFLLRLSIAIWNGFFGPSPGAAGDSMLIHGMAVNFPEDLILEIWHGLNYFTFLLSKVYSATTDTLFWGCLLSCFAWVGSAIFLLKIMDVLSFSKRNKAKAMLVYVLLPSSIFFTGITLREPYQLLFVNISIFLALKVVLNKSFFHGFIFFPVVIGMSALHKGLFVFGFLIVVSTLIMLVRGRIKGFSFGKMVIVMPVITLIVFLGLSYFTDFSRNYTDKNGAEFIGAVEKYRNTGAEREGRAQYIGQEEIKGKVDFLLYSPKIIFSYFFEPMPWRSLIAIDFVVILENLLRAWLIWRSWIGFRKLPTQFKSPLIFIFANYLMLEILWSMGTINWGTALRHHLPGLGMLVVSAFFYSKDMTLRPKV
jgi:hypothetical protein